MKKTKRTKNLPVLRYTALALTAVCAMSVLTACGDEKKEVNEEDTLTYWVRLHPNTPSEITNFGETPFAKEYCERTGVKVRYIHPAYGQDRENLNLLIASGNLPDIIEADWLERDPEASISKHTILRLNDLIDTSAPNLKRFLNDNPEIDKEVRTDNGSYYVFPFIRNGEKLLSTAGFMLRGDWLKELGMSAPETVDEWESVLLAFKEKCGATAPLVGQLSTIERFSGAFGVGSSFYLDQGQVKYGCQEPQFKKFLEVMHRWYRMGLVDKNFALMDDSYITTKILSGEAGATFGAGGGALGVWNVLGKNDDNADYELVAAKFPTEEKGQIPEFGNKQWPYSSMNGAAISVKNKKPELTAKFLDYSYSDEGGMLNNFGIRGESYVMQEGKPCYTDLITNNADGKSMAQMLSMYVRASGEAPFVQDERYIDQYYQTDVQKEALKLWGESRDENHVMPQVTLTQDERSEYSKIMTNFTTFRDENIIAFIIGSRPIDEFDSFVEECKSRGIDRVIAIYQAAYERFMNR